MAGQEALVEKAISDPLSIYQSDTHADRHVFYRLSELPPPFRGGFVRVIVEYSNEGNGRHQRVSCDWCEVPGDSEAMADGLTVATLQIDALDQQPIDAWTVDYEKREDVLYIRVGEPRAATSVDLGEIWARVDPETGDVLGFEIEGFRAVFLARHPELRPVKNGTQQNTEKAHSVGMFMNLVRKVCRTSGDASGGGYLPA